MAYRERYAGKGAMSSGNNCGEGRPPVWLLVAGLLLLAVCGCERKVEEPFLPGYIEGEWVYVSAPVSGALRELVVAKGDTVPAGAPLFVLDPEPEATASGEAEERLHAATAHLENLRKGLRPSELDALKSQLTAARAAAALSEVDKGRAEKLAAGGVIPQAELDNARTVHERNVAQVAGLEAQLVTAGLGARTDEIRAAEADVATAAAQLEQARWKLGQKRQAAPAAGLIQDTLFRPGEWVAAGTPVVMLLPPENVKIRFFAPEPQAAVLKPGQTVRVRADGLPERPARIRFISNQAEYTPPVLFSRDNRAKLVFMIEAAFEPESGGTAVKAPAVWKPGMPVEVLLP